MKELIKELIIKIDMDKYEKSLKNITTDINENILIKKKELLKELLNNENIYKYHLNLYDKEIIDMIKKTYQ
jgi:hypothetical protein